MKYKIAMWHIAMMMRILPEWKFIPWLNKYITNKFPGQFCYSCDHWFDGDYCECACGFEVLKGTGGYHNGKLTLSTIDKTCFMQRR